MTGKPFAYRDENGRIILDELLGPEHVRHYTGILNSTSEEFSASQLAMSLRVLADGPEQPRRAHGGAADYGPADGYLVQRGGGLPSRASSCRDLEPVPSHCWDVCGYYRRLGVRWKASVRELRLAYLSLDPRQEREDLHYALTQLLDPAVRRAYDMMPRFGLFMGDREVLAGIRRQAAAEAAARRAAEPGLGSGTFSAVLGEWGFEEVPAGEARQRVTRDGLRRPSAGPLRRGGGSLRIVPGWKSRWAYYVLVTDDHDERLMPGAEDMEAWQALVSAALSWRGIRAGFAVGAWTGRGPRVLRNSNEPCIFVTGRKPGRAAAEAAVSQAVLFGYIR